MCQKKAENSPRRGPAVLVWHLWGNDDLMDHRATSYCGAVFFILLNKKYVITECLQVGVSKKAENSPRHGPAVLVWHLWGNDDLTQHRATSYCGAVFFILSNQKYVITTLVSTCT